MILNLSAYLHITGKGIDEVQRRVYKLNLKRRSVLIVLDSPTTIEYLLSKTVFPHEEIIEEIQYLVRDDFVILSPDRTPPPLGQKKSPDSPTANGKIQILDNITISEAKFMLIDFCVDSFKTQSQALIDEISASNTASDIRSCLRKIIDSVSKNCPERSKILLDVINEINLTA